MKSDRLKARLEEAIVASVKLHSEKANLSQTQSQLLNEMTRAAIDALHVGVILNCKLYDVPSGAVLAAVLDALSAWNAAVDKMAREIHAQQGAGRN